MKTWYFFEAVASRIWLFWVDPSKKVALALYLLAAAWTPFHAACVNELSVAKPKKAIFSDLFDELAELPPDPLDELLEELEFPLLPQAAARVQITPAVARARQNEREGVVFTIAQPSLDAAASRDTEFVGPTLDAP
jgi:hypothetical protein